MAGTAGRAHFPTLVKELGEAMADVVDADLDTALDPELADALVDLLALGSRLDAVTARVAARVESSKVWTDDGSKSCAAWLGRTAHRSRGECSAVLTRGRALRQMPHVDAAHADGRLSARHVRLLADAADAAPGNFSADETWLVARALQLRFDDFARVVRHWIHCAAPDDAESDAVERYRKRSVHLSGGLDGTGFMDVQFEPVGRAAFTEALRRIEQELWEADWADARDRLGEQARAADLCRSDAQRRYDALIEMARRSAATPPGARKPVPLVTVLVGEETLGRVCELSTGTVLTPGEVLPLLCECEVERAVFDGPSRLLDLGERRRFFTGATRRAVEICGRRCAHPTCTTPAHLCDVHHVVEWEHGGATVQQNGELRCPAHHPGRRRRSRPRGSDDTGDGDRHDRAGPDSAGADG